MHWTRPLALTLALALIPGTVAAKGLGPDDAAAKRAEIVDGSPEDPDAAVEQLTRAGEELGDPELFLLAARRAYEAADERRDPELARTCADRAIVARDIALHLADERNYKASNWRPVTRERAGELADEAKTLADEAAALIEAIEEERAKAAAEAEARRRAKADAGEDGKRKRKRKPKRERRPGTGLIAGGSAALVVGAGGLGMIGAGIALGLGHQDEAEGLVLPDEQARLDELDRKGATANAITYAGIGVAAVGIGVGVALIVVGVKKRKAAGPNEAAGLNPGWGRNRVLVGGWLERDGAGLALQGKF